jgi:hypothetical protein
MYAVNGQRLKLQIELPENPPRPRRPRRDMHNPWTTPMLGPMETAHCASCGTYKPKNEFRPSSIKNNHHKCKMCISQRPSQKGITKDIEAQVEIMELAENHSVQEIQPQERTKKCPVCVCELMCKGRQTACRKCKLASRRSRDKRRYDENRNQTMVITCTRCDKISFIRKNKSWKSVCKKCSYKNRKQYVFKN